jgi:putative heme degradation protein
LAGVCGRAELLAALKQEAAVPVPPGSSRFVSALISALGRKYALTKNAAPVVAHEGDATVIHLSHKVALVGAEVHARSTAGLV